MQATTVEPRGHVKGAVLWSEREMHDDIVRTHELHEGRQHPLDVVAGSPWPPEPHSSLDQGMFHDGFLLVDTVLLHLCSLRRREVDIVEPQDTSARKAGIVYSKRLS